MSGDKGEKTDTPDWTCEHGVVRAEGCREYGCCGCDPDDPCFCFPSAATPEPRYIVRPSAIAVQQARALGVRRYPLREVEWAKNRADTDARYRGHLLLGPDRCACGMCRRQRGQ